MAVASREPGPDLRRRGVGLPGETAPTTGLHVPRRTHRRIAAAAKPYRHPWSNPILWRELMTRAYGAKPLIIKGCYVLLFALGMTFFFLLGQGMENPLATGLALIPIGLAILSLILVNAQGVTALTSERDTGALDLLLVTELTPKEFIYGKLYGILYNSKEMIALPVLTAIAMAFLGMLTGENLVLFLIDFLLLCHFAAMLGLHAAITYTSSRTAVANSLGTIFFLMVGILICAFLIMLNDQEVRPPASQLHDLHRGRQRGALRLAGRQESFPRHHAGRAPDAVLDVLLHHQPAQRRHHGGVPGERRDLWLRHAGDARSGRRRLRHRPGPYERDPGIEA